MKITFSCQALLLAAATWVIPASGSVQVYGEADSTGPNVRVQVYADITGPDILSYTFKLFYNPGQLQVLTANRNEAVWYFHDGTRSLPYVDPEKMAPGQVLFVGGHLDLRTPHTGVTGNHVLLGTVVFARSTAVTPSFDLAIGHAGEYASFVTIEGVVLEAQPGEVSMQSIKPDPDDQDLDGLSDRWEIKFFGTTRGVFYSDDPDGDGVNNLGEQALGSDPTDPLSNLHLTLSEQRGRALLRWDSVEGRIYTIEVGKEPGRFQTLQEGIKATPPFNSLELDRGEFGDTAFFRVRLETPAVR